MKTIKRTLTPAKAVKILEGYGTKITLEEAEIMLDFLYEFVKIAIDQQLQAKPEQTGLINLMNEARK
ncbi:MAG: hypothetical protein EOP48_00065 [Sphingobacteriales bacterium]|nr:MAG: hypothetical protein EOP48_00065 [Sphingobacteriales bacterium]